MGYHFGLMLKPFQQDISLDTCRESRLGARLGCWMLSKPFCFGAVSLHTKFPLLQCLQGPMGPDTGKWLSMAARCFLVRETINAQNIHLTAVLSSFRHGSA